MYAAVAEFSVVQVGFLGTFACKFGDTGDGFAFFLAFLNFLFDDFRDVGISVEVVIHVFFDEVSDELVHTDSGEREGFAFHVFVGRHGERTEFDFCLAFEEGFDDSDGDGGNESVSHVLYVIVFPEELLDGSGDVFLERALVGAALGRVLTVHEGVVFFTVLGSMGEGDVDVVSAEVNDGIESGSGHVVVEEVFEPIATEDAAPVVEDGKSCVEIGVVPKHVFDELTVELVVVEEFGVGFEEDVGSVFLLRVSFFVADEDTFLENGFVHFPLSAASCDELGREGVDSLETDAVHSDGGGEDGSVIFSACVEFGDGFHEFAERNASPVVTDFGTEIFVDVDFDAFAKPFVELVNAVVDAFLQQDVNAVFGVGTVAQASDVHAGAGADVFRVFQMTNL